MIRFNPFTCYLEDFWVCGSQRLDWFFVMHVDQTLAVSDWPRLLEKGSDSHGSQHFFEKRIGSNSFEKCSCPSTPQNASLWSNVNE